MSAKHNKRMYDARKAAGLCTKCGKPANGRALCETHAEQARSWHRDWLNRSARASYARRRAQHRCLDCGEALEPTNTHSVRCPDCRAEGKAQLELKRFAAEETEPRPDVPRCRCGLALPCNSCVPSIYELASSRKGAGPTYPTGAP